MQDLKKTGRLRSAADLITGVMLPTAVTESAAAIKHSGEVAGYAVVQMDRTELFNSIFFWVRVGVGGFTGAILLLGLPFIILLQRHFKDRSRVDQQLTLERETLALAIKAANAGFFENDLITGRMTWSPYLKEIMGYTDPAFSPTADFFGSLVHPEDHSELMAQGQQLRQTGKPLTIEIRARHAAGDYIWLRIFAIAQRDLAGRPLRNVGLVSDITAERNAIEALRSSESRFRALIDSSKDVIIQRSTDGRIIYASPSVEAVTGYSQAEAVAGRLSGNVHPSDVPIFIKRNDAVRNGFGGIDTPILYRLRRKTGEWVWLESTSAVVTFSATEKQILSISRNVTDRVERESSLREARDALQVQANELASLAREVDAARDKADRANKAKSHFLAAMSHELRTPMSGILAASELLLRDGIEGPHRTAVESIGRSAMTLLGQLNDILDLSKIEAGQVRVAPESFVLGRVIDDLKLQFAPIASGRGNILAIAVDASLPHALHGDPRLYRQVLINLIGNANKFSQGGRIEVAIAPAGFPSGNFALVTTVRDTGIGISADDCAKLFQPFAQADGSISSRFGGTGLGLAISKNLVSLMGGEIGVESTLGIGSTFRFTVQMAPGVAPEERVIAPSAPVKPLKLLLADDNETNRTLYATLLRRAGHSVTTASDGAEALRAAEGESFDAILMDIQMPVMNGTDAIIAIRTGDNVNVDKPIIALTADAYTERHGTYIAAGADAIVTKPVNWDLLAAELATLTGQTHLTAAGSPTSAPGDSDLDTEVLASIEASVPPETLAAIMSSLDSNLKRYADEIAEGVRAGDQRRAKLAAHALKGLAGQFGLRRVAATAEEIEENTTDQDSWVRRAAEIPMLIERGQRAAADRRATL